MFFSLNKTLTTVFVIVLMFLHSDLSYSDTFPKNLVNEQKSVVVNNSKKIDDENIQKNSEKTIDKKPSNNIDTSSKEDSNTNTNLNIDNTISTLYRKDQEIKHSNNYIDKYLLYTKFSPSLNYIYSSISDKSLKHKSRMSLNLALGATYNIGNSKTFFISAEFFSISMCDPLKIQVSKEFTSSNNKKTEEHKIIKDIFYGAVGAGFRFGINLFNGMIALYIKPNVGVSFFETGTQEVLTKTGPSLETKLKSLLIPIPIYAGIGFIEKYTNNIDFKNTKMHYRIMYGASIGVDISLTKYIFVAAELNYNYLPYKISFINWQKIHTLKNKYNLISLSLGLGIRF